jgi:hypothetical protein
LCDELKQRHVVEYDEMMKAHAEASKKYAENENRILHEGRITFHNRELKRLEAERETQRLKIESETNQFIAEKERYIEEFGADKLADTRKAIDERIAEMNAAYETLADQTKALNVEELENTRHYHAAQLEELRAKYLEQQGQTIKQFNDECSAKLEKLRIQCEEAETTYKFNIKVWNDKNTREIEDIENNHSLEIKRITDEIQARINKLKNAEEDEISAAMSIKCEELRVRVEDFNIECARIRESHKLNIETLTLTNAEELESIKNNQSSKLSTLLLEQEQQLSQMSEELKERQRTELEKLVDVHTENGKRFFEEENRRLHEERISFHTREVKKLEEERVAIHQKMEADTALFIREKEKQLEAFEAEITSSKRDKLKLVLKELNS